MSPRTGGLVVDADAEGPVRAAVEALGSAGIEGVVFVAAAEPACWDEVEDRLTAAFVRTKAAAESNLPIAYIVREEDLSGTRGPLSAAVAGALLSYGRALAMERAKYRQAANVVSFGADTDPGRITRCLRFLLDPAAPSGELVELGSNHFGRTRP